MESFFRKFNSAKNKALAPIKLSVDYKDDIQTNSATALLSTDSVTRMKSSHSVGTGERGDGGTDRGRGAGESNR